MPIRELSRTGIGNIRTLRPSIFRLEIPRDLWRLCPNLPQCSWPSSLDPEFLRTSIAYLVDRCDTHRRCSSSLEILRGHRLPLHPPPLQAHFCVSFLWQTSVCMPVPVAKHFIVKYSSIHHVVPAKHSQARSSESGCLSIAHQSEPLWTHLHRHTHGVYLHLCSWPNIQMCLVLWIALVKLLKNIYGKICSYCSVGNIRINCF